MTESVPRRSPTLGAAEQRGAGVSGTRHAVARTLFSRACNLDDVPACVEFARFTHAGRGGEQDRPTGRQLLDLGCRRGILDACVDLAEIYEEGVGVEPDLARAEAFRRHACEAGWQAACPREDGSGDDPQP